LPALWLGRKSADDGVEVNGIRIVKDGIVTVGVVPISDTSVALIDAGNDKAGAAILAELFPKKTRSAMQLTAIFITHGTRITPARSRCFPKRR